MKQWIKLETSLMDDPRIQKLIDSNLRYEGLGIYIGLRLLLGSNLRQQMHINNLRTLVCRNVGFSKINHVLNDFELFWIDGNGMVSLRAGSATCHATRHATCHVTPEPLGLREENRKENNKENFEVYENGNHDFDPRWY